MINNKKFPTKKTTEDNHKSRDLEDKTGKFNNKPYKSFKGNNLGVKKDFKNSYASSKQNKYTNKTTEKIDRKSQQKPQGSFAPKDKSSFGSSSNYTKNQSKDQKGGLDSQKTGNVVELKKINHLYNELMTKKKGLNVEDGRSKFKVIDDILKIISGILIKVH